MGYLAELNGLEVLQHQPERLTAVESWHRHIPFAFALMHWLRPQMLVELGTHRGDSYSAFCQAVVQQGLATRCFAVDTWQGDEHAGEYGSDVLDDLCRWHNPRYSAFSSLLRMRFDEALEQFADGSIDLLHIDGLHTYEAVRDDFESWLPRLSERAVVLFHDTNVRHGDFGVWKLWEELSVQYPAFEFPFGFGLGVLAVGKQVPMPVLEFIDYARDNSRAVVDFFHRAGDAAEIRKRSEQIIGLQQRIEGQGRQLATALEQLQLCESRCAQLQQQLAAVQVPAEPLADEAGIEQLARQAAQLRIIVESRSWKLRNQLMRLIGRGDRVIELDN